jgi:hypothetical protein
VLNERWAQDEICYFGRHLDSLKYFTHQLILIPVLVTNCKLHILSPAEVRKVCYSLAEIYVRTVYFNLFEWS